MLFAVLIVLLLAGCGRSGEAVLPPGSRVLVIGDSITAGYVVGAAAAWPARLAERTGWDIVAAGVSGDRTAGGLERLPALLDAHRPELVIIELGGNDLLRGVPPAEIVANLTEMINAARDRGARIALMAAPQPSGLGLLTSFAPAALFADVAKASKVPLIEKALPSVLSEPALKLDMLHPTAEGHRVLAQRVGDELVRIGYLPRS